MRDPPQGWIKEYLRPWKLSTLGIGVALLIYGSFYYKAPDWDIPISLIMAFFAYIYAPWSLRVLLEHDWANFPKMLFVSWFTIDGCYSIYWYIVDPVAWDLMREVNAPASLCLYLSCGLVWYHNGTLKEMFK